MRCPECDTEYGDSLGRVHCKECNTHLIIRTDKLTGSSVVSIETPLKSKVDGSGELKLKKRIRFTPISEPDYTTKCYFCGDILNAATKVEGTTTVGFDKRDVEVDGVLVERHIPRIKKVSCCSRDMDKLTGMRKTDDLDELGNAVYEQYSTVKPTLSVNPREERFKYGRSEVRRSVKDVTYDTVRADPHDPIRCTTFTPFALDTMIGVRHYTPDHCVYCGQHETDHGITLTRSVHIERFNIAK